MSSLMASTMLMASAVAMSAPAAVAEEPIPMPGPEWQDDSEDVPFGFHGGMQDGIRAGFMLVGFWEDGVLDESELAQLPEGHPLTDPDGAAAQFLADGRITAEEHEQLQAIHQAAFEARAEYRAERRADAEARREMRAQYQAECEQSDDCPYGPVGPGGFGPGWGRGSNV